MVVVSVLPLGDQLILPLTPTLTFPWLASLSSACVADYYFASRFEDKDGKIIVKNAFPTVKSWTKIEDTGEGWGKTILNVRARLIEAAAFFWDFEGCASADTTEGIERVVLEEEEGKFEKVVRRRQNGLDFVYKMSLHVISYNKIVIVAETEESRTEESRTEESRTDTHGFARASEKFSVRLLRRGDLGTKVEFVTTIGFDDHSSNSSNSSKIMQRLLEQRLHESTIMKAYFEYAVEVQDMTEKDGEALGHQMIWLKEGRGEQELPSSASGHHDDSVSDDQSSQAISDQSCQANESARSKRVTKMASTISRRIDSAAMSTLAALRVTGAAVDAMSDRVEEVMEKSAALKAVMTKYPFVLILAQRARRGAVAANRPITTDLNCLKEEEARIIGNNLMPALKRNRQTAAAVDQWRMQNKAVDELLAEYPWMKGLFLVLGQEVVNSAPWGVKFRVLIGAALSTLDLLTDIFMTYTYWKDGETMFFRLNYSMLFATIVLQLMLVWAQNHRLGFNRILSEMIPVVFGLKPVLDAFRVASGARMKDRQLIDPKMEQTAGKCAEMFSEAIPGAIIQLSAIMSRGSVSSAAGTSLIISALTTGFTSASLSYDWDVDPFKRNENPKFYGYVPYTSRKKTIVFTCLFFTSALMLLCKATVLVLLGLIDANYAYLYFFVDIAIYILYKVLRSDFMYWLPVYGILGAVISTITRVIVKVITDFTSNVHFRHPQELGGFYWAFNFVLSIVSLPSATMLYARDDKSSDDVLRLATSACYALVPSVILLNVVFFASIKKDFRRTFWSLNTAEDFVCEYFESDLDSTRKMVFMKSKHKWKKISADVKKWVGDNWSTWMDEEPDWFDDNFKASVPPDMIPDENDREKVEQLKRERRRSSFEFNVTRKTVEAPGSSRKGSRVLPTAA